MGDTLQTGGDAGVVRVHGTKKALAITTDCTPRYVYADPYEGGKQAIAEAYRNLCVVGARPLAVTNCLNFANPQRPEIMAQFVHALEGMGDACRALDFPIVSGNVSLYNESKATGGGSAILPTPAIGGVGIIDDYSTMMTMDFAKEGESIIMIGHAPGHLGQSLWQRIIHGTENGDAPAVDLAVEKRLGELVRKLIAAGRISAAHDISDGGALVAVAEMAMAGNLGVSLNLPDHLDPIAACFGEDQGRILVSTSDPDIIAMANEAELYAVELGKVGGDSVSVASSIVSLADLREAHASFFRDWMEN
jgi:phosphoribosylformylglycinamidine synthase